MTAWYKGPLLNGLDLILIDSSARLRNIDLSVTTNTNAYDRPSFLVLFEILPMVLERLRGKDII